jgi:hypothetical protein
MRYRLLSIIIILSLLMNIRIEAGTEDHCGTTSGSSAPFLRSSRTTP